MMGPSVWRTWLCVTAFALLVVPAGAAQAALPLKFQRIGVTEGLSQRAVRALAEDRHGDLWIGTQEGLNRYDGLRIDIHRRQDDGSGLPSNQIGQLAVDGLGQLWAGTEGGLARYDEAADRFVAVPLRPGDDPAGQAIGALMVDARGQLWVGSTDGIARRGADGFEWFGFDVPGAPRMGPPRAMAESDAGGVWIGSSNGLWHFDPETTKFQPAQKIHAGLDWQGPINALLAMPGGGLWLGGNSDGLAYYDVARDRLRHWRAGSAVDAIASDLVLSLLRDADGTLWVGTDLGVEQIAAPTSAAPVVQSLRHRRHDRGSLGKGEVHALLRSRDGNLWVGTWADGVSRHHPYNQRFTSFHADLRQPWALPADTVSYLDAEADGRLLVGGDMRLYHFDPDRGGSTPVAGSEGNYVLDVERYPDGLLLATRGGLRWLGKPDAAPQVVRDAPEANAFTLWRDGQSLWIGYFDGQLRIEPETAASRVHAGLGWIRSIHPLNTQHVLVGGTGLYWLERSTGRVVGKLSPSRPTQGLGAQQSIGGQLIARDGRHWLSSYGAGLLELTLDAGRGPEGARLRRWGRSHGLDSESITAIYEDASGLLWLATNRGISRFDPASERVRNYGPDEGALESGYFVHADTRLPDGRLAFGGPDGLTVFDPARIGPAPPPPRPRIQRVRWGKQSLRPGSDRALRIAASDARDLRIEFAAPYFVAPRQVRFEVWMEGLDTRWRAHTGSEPELRYAALSPGHYRFHLRVANADGEWHPQHAELRIEVLPPWWASPSALAAAGLLSGAALLLAYRYRVARLLRRRRELESLVAERTADLQASITREREHEKLLVREKLATASQITAGLAHEINNPVNFVALAAQNQQEQLQRFHAFLHELAGSDAEPEVLDAFAKRFAMLDEQLAQIRDGTGRVADIVRDLRAFSRLDPLEPQPTRIAELLAATVRLAGARYRQLIAFELDLAVDPPVRCLPARLNQAFMNLVINACHAVEARFEREGPDFRGRVAVRSALRGNELVIEIEDNGDGVDEAIRERIFEPFFTTKSEGKGTGLGLAVTRVIVEEHGGRIVLEATQANGSRFVVHLPLSKGHENPTE